MTQNASNGDGSGLWSYAYGGTTRVIMTSDSGDPAGQGQTYNLVPGAESFRIAGGRSYLRPPPSTLVA